MILLYSQSIDAKQRIASLLLKQTDETVVVATTPNGIVELAREHKPTRIFMFMPGSPATAIDIQMFLGHLMPHVRVCILPTVQGSSELIEGWQNTVVEALSPTHAEKVKAEALK